MTILKNHPKVCGQCKHCDKDVFENNGILFHDSDGNFYCDFKGVPTKTTAELKTETSGHVEITPYFTEKK